MALVICPVLGSKAQGVPEARQIGRQEFSPQHLSIRDGLSQGMINHVAEDSKGFLWVATKEGLNRYDGKEFKVYRHDPSDSLSISDNFTYSLAVDASDRIWVATQSHGVDMLDPATGIFHHYRSGSDRPDALTSDNMGVMLKDKRGNIIIETLDEHGFNVILCGEDSTGGGARYDVKPLLEVYPELTRLRGRPDWSRHLLFSQRGDIWYFDGDSIHRSHDGQISSFYFELPEFKGGRYDQIFIYDRTSDDVYMHDYGQELFRFDPERNRFEVVLRLPAPFAFLHKQFFDREGRLWTWTKDDDLLRIDLGLHSFELYSPRWQRLEPQTRNHTGINMQDRNGNLWIGTGGNGLLKINRFVDRFRAVPDEVKKYQEGLYLFRTERTGTKNHFAPGTAARWNDTRAKVKARYPHLNLSDSQCHLTMDDRGFFWTGGYFSDERMEHLLKIDPRSGEVHQVVSAHHDSSEWFAQPVFLSRDNDVWFGEKYTDEHIHLYRYAQAEDSLYRFRFPVKRKKLEYRFISDWYEDRQGDWWFATTQGVFHFRPKTEEWKHYRNDPTDSASLPLDMTLSICPDPQEPERYIWCGTEGRGLSRLDIRTGRFSHVTAEDGLPNGVIYGILPDKRGNLWLSTNSGLASYAIATGGIRTYTEAEGLPGNEFNRYEYSMTEEGIMYFGGTSGIVHFDPEHLQESGAGSPVLISGMEVSYEKVAYGQDPRGLLDAPMEYCKAITLRHDQNTVSLRFALLDLTAPERHKFRYRLRGLQESWVDAGMRSEATFTDLSPGLYTFEVAGLNSFGQWTGIPASIDITILPPWYATWWFRTFLLLVFASMLYAFYRYRLAQLLQVERMRNRIAQDLHDEIGSTLSSISLYSAVMQRSADRMPANINDILGKIIDSTSEMMESMNDMVWTIKADNDSFEHVVYRMRAFAGKMTEAKGMVLQFKADPKAEQLKLGMEKRKNIYLIFKEAVNNAVKYSDGRLLSTVIRQEDNRLIVQLKDDGIGFDPDNYNQGNDLLGGNGMQSMKNRAKEINAQLKVESAPGQGCTVTLEVPV